MSAGTRHQYTEDFKREVVRLVRESVHPVAQVAGDLGIPEYVWSRWRPAPAAQRAEAEELTRVEREWARVAQERDCLSRARRASRKESR